MGARPPRGRMDLTQGPVFKTLLLFSLPIFLGTIVTQLYNVADSVIVGQFIGKEALAAVSASTPVTTIINMFLIGLSAGSNVVIAQRFGAKNREALQRAIGTIALIIIICACFVTVLGLTLSGPLLRLMGTPADIFGESRTYLMIIFIGAFGNLMYNMGSGALRGMGDSTWPLIFLTICSATNVVLDLFVVCVLGWGVWGAAIATAVAQIASGIGILFRLNRGGYGVHLRLRDLHMDRYEAGQVVAIGLPAGIQNVGNAIAGVCVQGFVNTFGSSFIAANSVVTKTDDFVNIPLVALSTALCTFVGQNMGCFKMDRIKRGIDYSIFSLVGLGCFLCVGIIALRGVLPYAFNGDPEVVAMASRGLFVMSFMCTFHGIDRCLVMAMRGAGKSIVPMITAQFGAFSRIPLAYFLAVRANNYMGIFYALLIASAIRMLAIALYYFCGGWKHAVRKFEEKHQTAQSSPTPSPAPQGK